LDGLRFLAAAMVVGYHYTGVIIPFWGAKPSHMFPALNSITRYGYLGVDFFFIISGFVILMTAYGRKVEDFAASRIARLYPGYWAAVALTLVLQWFWDSGRQLDLPQALLNFTMLEEPFGAPFAQGAFWTLWPELRFYLLIGVLVVVGMTRRRVIAFAVFWPLLARLADASGQEFLKVLLISDFAPYFALGMMLFLLFRDGADVVVWLGAGLNLVLAITFSMAYAARATELVGEWVAPEVTAAIILVMVVAIWAVTSGPLGRIDWRWLTVVGALTYPLYLVHGQFGFFIIDVAYDTLPAYVVLLLAILVSLTFAIAIHYLVERRAAGPVRRAVRAALTRPARVPGAEEKLDAVPEPVVILNAAAPSAAVEAKTT
jgi:peptidoglycan/LPS O-acetylase OafA/YrhL